MRILYFIDSLRSGGKERRLTELMKMIGQSGEIQFELVVMSPEIHYKEVLDLGIKIHYIIRAKKRDISAFYTFYKLCYFYKPDIVHCWDSMTAIYSIPACKLLDIRLINGMVMITPEKLNIFNKNWWRSKFAFPFSDVIIGNSIAGLSAYRAPQSKSHCIFNGFNFDRINNIINKEIVLDQIEIKSGLIIGMVASFSEKKDYKTYFIAAQMILQKRNDITFLAIGSDTDSANSKNLIEPKLMQYFRLLGTRSDVESYINVMDICILSTFTEGISNSILEYMAMGKPVIATDGGGTNEILEDTITGYLISPCNPLELSARIEELIVNAELRKKMGAAGKDRIQNNFSIGKMVEKYISIYKEAV
jgi:glycosyltransferase involved in cell wall biosynthesis